MTSRGPAGPTDVVITPAGVRLERLVAGAGEPGTVFAHGLAGDIASTRPLASGVVGRRIFFHLRGHGGSAAPPGPWTPDHFADDLAAVADVSAARRAVGVSLGAAALLRLVAREPDRFERLVVFLPAAQDAPRPAGAVGRVRRLRDALDAADGAALTSELAVDVPPELRHTADAAAYLRRRVTQLRTYGLAEQLAGLPATPPADAAALAAVTAPVLVIGCHGDDMHPAAAARRIAAALPGAALHLYDDPFVVWRHRVDLRRRISAFLNA